MPSNSNVYKSIVSGQNLAKYLVEAKYISADIEFAASRDLATAINEILKAKDEELDIGAGALKINKEMNPLEILERFTSYIATFTLDNGLVPYGTADSTINRYTANQLVNYYQQLAQSTLNIYQQSLELELAQEDMAGGVTGEAAQEVAEDLNQPLQ